LPFATLRRFRLMTPRLPPAFAIFALTLFFADAFMPLSLIDFRCCAFAAWFDAAACHCQLLLT